ncbi:DUF6883 domain-containing protein [Leptolyngbya sp. FACHB-17]|uniref:DUF6883 domain-containing protein n=1 Tax=unclassified Leptolyngbya TaxID=2650499 RepID=UPI00321FA41C
MGLEEAEELRSALRQALATQDAIPVSHNSYGQKYRIDIEMTRSDKQAIIRNIWIVRDNENFPRLVPCYVL